MLLLEVMKGPRGEEQGERRKERRMELPRPEHPLGTRIRESPPWTSRHWEKRSVFSLHRCRGEAERD